MARPSILTDAIITDFCNKLRICGNIETAIIATDGVTRRSYYNWARAVREGGGGVMARKFIAATEKALGDTKLLAEHAVREHFKREWTAAAWWLERRFPLEYSRRNLPQLSDKDPDLDGEEKKVTGIVWVEAPPKQIAPPPPAPPPPPPPPPAPAAPPPEPAEPGFTVTLKPD